MKSDKLSLGQKIAYAVPGAPIAALGLPILVYLPPFYESLGLSLSMVGIIFMINRLWDVVTDPLLGVLSDRFPSRWGRRRHWLVISLPILMLSTYMLFLPPPSVSGLYLGGWLFVLYIGYTIITLSHNSWGTELSSNYYERSSIHGIREIAIILGMITVLALPAMLDQSSWFNRPGEKFTLANKIGSMGIYVILLLPISLVIALLTVGEKSNPSPSRKIDWREFHTLIIANKALRRLLSADVLVGVAIGTTGSLYLYFYDAYFNLANYSSALLLLYFVSGCCAVPIWIKLSHKMDKHRLFSIACIYSALAAPLVLVVPKGELAYGIISTIVYGVSSGATPFLARSMMGDITDKYNLDTGAQRTGLFFSILSLTNKIGSAFAVGLAYLSLDLMGFVPYSPNSADAVQKMSMLYVCVPALCMLLASRLMWNYPLNLAAQEDCRRKIELRDGATSMQTSS